MSTPGTGLPSVVHLSHFDEYGGAARSAYRLHVGLRLLGARSRMIVGSKRGDDPDIEEHGATLADRVADRVGYELGIQYAYFPSTRSLRRHRWLRDADVLQLANIHGGWFSHAALPRLARGKRLVWCLHDMWSFTGHCGYSYGHDGWLKGCGDCPHLDAYPALRRDRTRLNWQVKQRIYRELELDVVAPSRWLADQASRSPLLGRFPVHVIPYGVDTEVFSPVPRAEARAALGLPEGEAMVLVAGIEPRKGSDLLGTILAGAERGAGRPVSLAVAGGTANAEPPPGHITHLLGDLDEPAMRLAYAASDVYLLPTRYDNLPNTVLEAMACGSPIVATAVGGIPDVIEDGSNGLVRRPDGAALGRAVADLLNDPELGARLGAAARNRARGELTLEHQARAYLDLYCARPRPPGRGR